MDKKLTELEVAIKRGLVKKKWRCERCNSGERLEYHRPDPAKPLEGRWLCNRCEHQVKGLRDIMAGKEL